MQADLNTLDGGMDQLLDAQAQIGATTARLESTRDQLSLTQIHTLDQISKIEDVDFTEAATEFAIQETVYKAALAAASKAIQPSLLDYLR
jgi:flagellar hook-associated protein 3 FlgL